eukprot:TRINITY_DN11714_c0_g1_i2.p1 TRINITY_DN11714_c0_g1~~TRINITY_DN11714_c0_g1_i2.p1  ORF type:complete len:250 (-),score=72.10 TRINITY_DN11714_c0_g1_i2:32-781(-)
MRMHSPHHYRIGDLDVPAAEKRSMHGKLIKSELLVKALVERGRAISADPVLQYITYFKNVGQKAGASIRHPHAQVVGLPVVPVSVQARLAHASHYYDKFGKCVNCEAMEEEQAAEDSRIISENEHFLAFVPYAAVSPYQCWIMPKRHSPHFVSMSDDEIHLFAHLLHDVLHRLDITLHQPDYNLVIHSSPFLNGVFSDHHARHWYADVFPRLAPGGMAGFEFGSGMFSNSSLPESNAAALRAVNTAVDL